MSATDFFKVPVTFLILNYTHDMIVVRRRAFLRNIDVRAYHERFFSRATQCSSG